jgi:hypothetical protein
MEHAAADVALIAAVVRPVGHACRKTEQALSFWCSSTPPEVLPLTMRQQDWHYLQVLVSIKVMLAMYLW